jgi:Calpain family cysteine protease
MSRHRQRPVRNFRFENLEPRRVMATGITAAINAAGLLTVTGSDGGNDQILFRKTNNTLSIAGVNGAWSAAKVKSISITLNGGNDFVSLDSKASGGNQALGESVRIVSGDGNEQVRLVGNHNVYFSGLGNTLTVLSNGNANQLDGAAINWSNKVTTALKNGVLTVTGTNGDDLLRFLQTKGIISIGGVSGSWSATKVTSIIVNLQDGNDTVSLDSIACGGNQALVKNVTITSGIGNKVIHLAGGHDVIFNGFGHVLQVSTDGTVRLDGNLVQWNPTPPPPPPPAALSATASFQAGSGNVVGSAILADSAILSGGSNESGSITFTLTAPDGSTSTVGTVTVTGAGTYNAPTVLATQVGTYTWHAGYSGDSLNNSAIDNGQNDSLATIKATAVISSTASFGAGSGNVAGSAILTDSATLSGGYNDSGTITFTLTAPDGSTSTVGTVTVTGAGTYNAPTVLATQVGTYTWHISYSGDGLNNSALDNGQNDSLLTIAPLPPVQTWFDTHIQTAAIRTLADADFQDGVLSRTEMIGLFRQVEQAGAITSTEQSDLTAIVTDTSLFGGFDYVQVLSSDIVLGNTANAHYQGAALGNLAVGSSATQLEDLVDKWFFGTDHPVGTDDFGNTYSYRQVSGILFGANGPSYTDVQQGEIGDCYFLASLAELAIQNPSAITSMFIVNGDGTYTVRFYNGSHAQYVTVDQQLPTDPNGTLMFDGLGANAASANNVLWVALAEKAYVEMNECGWIRPSGMGGGQNVYTDISSGDMSWTLGQVTGQATIAYEPTLGSTAFTTLATAFNAGKSICLGSVHQPPDSQVIGNHAYAVLAVDTAAQTVTLFNPWGINYGLLTLAWSDVQANLNYFDQIA